MLTRTFADRSASASRLISHGRPEVARHATLSTGGTPERCETDASHPAQTNPKR
jgi:hypothetical protein